MARRAHRKTGGKGGRPAKNKNEKAFKALLVEAQKMTAHAKREGAGSDAPPAMDALAAERHVQSREAMKRQVMRGRKALDPEVRAMLPEWQRQITWPPFIATGDDKP